MTGNAMTEPAQSAPVLKPCPFCGGAATLIPVEKWGLTLHKPHCSACSVNMAYFSPLEWAVTAWNTRAAPSAPAEKNDGT